MNPFDDFNSNLNFANTAGGQPSAATPSNPFDQFNSQLSFEKNEEEPKKEYGVLDRQRDTRIAITGDKNTSTAQALAENMLPYAGRDAEKQSYLRLKDLQSFADGSALLEVNAEANQNGGKPKTAQLKREKMYDRLGNIIKQEFFKIDDNDLDEQNQEAKLRELPTEESKIQWLKDKAINKAGMNADEVEKLHLISKSAEDFAKNLQFVARDELKKYVQARKDAQNRLDEHKAGPLDTILNGIITNSGYMSEFILGGATLGAGNFASIALEADKRFEELTTKGYDVDEDGNLVIKNSEDEEIKAAAKSASGAAAEIGIEIGLDAALGYLFKGVNKIAPGATKAVSKTLASAVRGVSKNKGAAAFVKLAKKSYQLGKVVGYNGMPMELAEEHVQSFFDDVIGLGSKDADLQGDFGSRAKDWWNNQVTDREYNTELALNLAGTMLGMGAVSFANIKRNEAKWRKDPAGLLKMMIDEKIVDKMSTDDIEMFSNLVSNIAHMESIKPGMGLKYVEDFINGINNDADKVLAATQIKNATEPWVKLSDEELKGIKSKYQVPMRDSQIAGGKEIDFRQFELKNGEKVMRATDPNTGIAIDRIDPTHFVVTSRDGLRIPVTGANPAEAGQRALAQADKFSIQEQINDGSRQKKIDYINERIAKFGGRDKIAVVPNTAKLLELSPEIAQDKEFNPYNPAVRLGDGRIAIVADNVTSGYEANRLILHESGIHAGLRQHFKTEDMANFLAKINSPELEAWKKTLDEQNKAKGLDAIDWTDPKNIEEAFAHFWDRRRVNPSVWTKAVSQLREWGREAGLPLSYNEADLETLVGALQEEMRQGTNKKGEVVNKTGEEAGLGELEGMFTNEGYFPPASDMLDVTKPGAYSPEEIEVRKMERAERIKKKYPNAYKWAMKLKDNDEEAAIDWIAQNLRREKENGYVGELEHGTHALLVAEKLEQGRDLSKSDLEILDEHGFTGQRLYTDFGYRKQANGSWRQMVKPTNKATAPKTRENAPTSASAKTPTTTTPKAKEASTGGKSGSLPKESEKTPTPKPKENYFKAQAEAKKKEIKASHAKFINGYQQNPMSLFAFRDENGRLLKMPSRVRSFNPDTKQFEYKFTGKDPSVEALNHFFEGLTGEEYQTWMERIFGKEADRVSKGGNDTALEGIMSFIEGGRQLSHDEITNHKYSQDFGKLLSDFADEWADYEKFLKGGSLSREEQEAAYLEQQAAAEKADEDAYYLEQMAAQSEADEEYNNALGEVMQYGVNGKTIKAFTPENLKKLNRGDMVRFDHSDTAFDFVSYNEKTGELVLAPEGAVGNPLLTEDEQLIGNIRYVVTAEGISEYKEEQNGQENENRADQNRARDEGRKEEVKFGDVAPFTVEDAQKSFGKKGSKNKLTRQIGDFTISICRDPNMMSHFHTEIHHKDYYSLSGLSGMLNTIPEVVEYANKYYLSENAVKSEKADEERAKQLGPGAYELERFFEANPDGKFVKTYGNLEVTITKYPNTKFKDLKYTIVDKISGKTIKSGEASRYDVEWQIRNAPRSKYAIFTAKDGKKEAIEGYYPASDYDLELTDQVVIQHDTKGVMKARQKIFGEIVDIKDGRVMVAYKDGWGYAQTDWFDLSEVIGVQDASISDEKKPAKKEEPKKSEPAKKPANNAKMELAKREAEKHIVTYGNGGKDTLANMIKQGVASIYVGKDLYTVDINELEKGNVAPVKGANVVTIGFESFKAWPKEVPYLLKLQAERQAKEKEEAEKPKPKSLAETMTRDEAIKILRNNPVQFYSPLADLKREYNATPKENERKRVALAKAILEAQDRAAKEEEEKAKVAKPAPKKVESKKLQGSDSTIEEAENLLKEDLANILVEADLGDEVKRIKGLKIIGSRQRGDAREDSDLDVVFEYEGKMREDDLFNFLHEEEHFFDGIPVDFNPIRADKSGTLDEYLKRAAEYDKEKLAESKKPAAKKAKPKLEKVDLGEQNDAFDAELDAMFFNPDFDVEGDFSFVSEGTKAEFAKDPATKDWDVKIEPSALRAMKARKLDKLNPVTNATDNNSIKKAIKQLFAKWDKVRNRIDSTDVIFNGGDAGKMMMQSGVDMRQFAPHLKTIFETAMPMFDAPQIAYGDKELKPNVVGYKNYINKITDKDGDKYVRITVRVENKGMRKGVHAATVSAISVYETKSANSSVPANKSGGHSRTFVDTIIAKFLSKSQATNDTRFFNPNMDVEGGQGGNEYAIMFRHKDETPKQHYERLVKYYGRGIERAGKTFERALQSLFASERSFSEGKRRLQSVLKTSRIAAITPRGNETINDWVVARGYTKSTIYIPLGNEATEVQLKVGKILLHNEAFGDKLPLKIVGFGENNGILYAIGETRNIYKSNTSPYTWFRNNGWTIGRIADGFDGQGAEYFENTNYEVLASSAHIVTVDDGREIPFGVMIFDKRNNEYAKNRKPGNYQGDVIQQPLFFNPDFDVDYLEAVNSGDLFTAGEMVRKAASVNYDTSKTVFHAGSLGTRTVVGEPTYIFWDNPEGFHAGTLAAATERFSDVISGQGDFDFKARKTEDGKYVGQWIVADEVGAETSKSYKTADEAERAANMLLHEMLQEPDSAKEAIGVGGVMKLHELYLRKGLRLKKMKDIIGRGEDSWQDSIKQAKKEGYDGIAYTNEGEDKGSTSYLVWNNPDVKSAEPVTYDDNGEVIPLSKRFNISNGDIRFFNPDMDVKSEEEIEANNLIHGVKAIRAYAKAGRRDFATFAKAVATRKPEVYARIKTSLRGMWNTAIDKGVDLDEVSRDEVKKILADLDAALGNENGESGNKKPEVGNKEPKTETAPKKTETRTAEEIDRTKRVSKAADEVLALINSGVKFDRQTLTKAVEDAMGAKVAEGKLDMKDVYDIMELAINRKLMSMPSVNPASAADVKSAVKAIEDIRKILAIIPTQTTRTAEQDKMQQFSTPPHEAFMAAWVANVGKGDVSLEPSAGIGGIALYSKMAGANVIVNELSPRRASILAALGLSPKVYDFNAEDLYAYFYPLIKSGEVQRPTVVVMNPPFSNSQRTSIKDTFGIGGKHIEEALEMLAPGGRLVAIVGHGMAHDSESSKAAGWWKKIGSKYQVRADIRVNGKEYQKYGTTYDNNMIVIDKVAPNNTIKPIYGIIESLNDLPALLEGVRNERPTIQTAQNVQEGERSSSEQARTGNPRENGQTGNGGTSERAGSIPRGNRNGSSAVSGDLFANGSGETIRSSAKRGGRDRSSVGGPRGNGRVSTTQEGTGVLGGLSRGSNEQGTGVSAGARPGTGLSGTGNGNRGGNFDNELPLRAERQLDNLVIDSQNGSGEKSNDIRIIGNGTFAEYRPSKVNIPNAKKHPTPLQETTAMASVLPPDPTYKPILPKEGVMKGRPSDAQIEQILYAGQAHEQILPDGKRRGYFIGDGTGVGKGTEIAGIIADNFNHGRKKAIWITEKKDLLKDAMRDLNPYGLGNEVFEADPDKAKTIIAKSRGVAFSTYSSLIQNIVFNDKGLVVGTKKDKISRFQMLVDWFGKDYDGIIVFDESHNAANAVATSGKRGAKEASQAGQAVVALQEALPNARILYVSATGATEVSNLAYATRLGLWGQGSAFRDRESFVNQVSAGGLSVMEIVARDMKSMGVYMARSLSWEGVENRKLEHKLSADQKRKYNEFADAWQMVSENIRDALIQTKAAGNSQASSQLMSRFYSASQNFFNQILTAMQMPSVIADAKAQLEAGNSIVFQLVDTNEAAQNRSAKKMQAEQGEINAEELDLSPRDVLIQFVERSFPTAKYVLQEDEKGNPKYVRLDDSSGKPIEDPVALEAKQELLDKLRMMKVDENPLELIINEFGAENVAEITGRSKRREWVENEDGIREMRLVPRKKALRTVETDEFNEGKRRVLVFSKAGGTGRSFHADRTFKNHQKRIHYLIQAGWKADAALQGFGRTHRSNEAQPPEYVLVSTDIKGHQRFISTIARRLAQLGSLTAGDRSSAGSGIFTEADNLENSYAKDSVYQIFYDAFHNDMNRFNTICKQLGFMYPKMNTRTGESEEFNSLVDPETRELKEDRIPDVSQFLNRILMSRVDVQNELFDEFVGNMTRKIENAKASGKYDPGLQLLKGDSIEEKNRVQIWDNGAGTGKAEMVEVSVGKKAPRVDFEEVSGIMRAYQTNGQKTMFAENLKSGQIVALAETNNTKTLQDGTIVGQYRAFRPNGKKDLVTADGFNFSGEKQNFRLLNDAEAEVKWNDEYAKVPEMNYTPRFFIQGTLLPIWDKLNAKEPHIYRIAPSNGSQSFLGLEVKADNVNNILKRFGMATQQVKLSPEVIRDRILKEGKPVELQFDDGRLSLKRAKVNGDYRIEVVGFTGAKEIGDFANQGIGFTERIGYTPRFFIPISVEGIEKFLEQYPAKTEDGGLGGAQSAAGSQYAKMSPAQLNAALTDGINRIFGRASFNQESWDSFVRESQEIMSVMQTGELRSIVKDFTQYDRNNEYDPVRKVRKLAAGELIRRGESVESLTRGETMFFNPDFDVESPLSAVSIYEMNRWREARGMPIYSRKPTTTVKSIVKEAKYRSSNAEEMERLVDVVNRTPMNLTATEITATHQHLINLEKDWEAKDALFNEALLNGNAAQAEEIKKARDLVLEQIDKTQDAIRSSARQWGLAGLARRFMLNRDGNFVKFLGSLRADAGRKLTGEEEALARQLWDSYKDAQGKLDFATVKKTAEVLKDIVRKHNNAEIERHIKEAGKNMAEIERDYLFALDHIAVHAGRAGGLLTGLPNGRKWIDAIRRFHMAASIQAGHKMTVDEMLAAIHGDIDGLIKADDHDILQMITNYGNTYKPDDSAVEKALRDQREMMRELQKQADLLEGKLPKKTGRLADTPSDELRQVKRDTAEIMRNLLEEHPELMAVDNDKKLRTIQQAWMRRVQNEINDLQKAIETGSPINRKKSSITYNEEMRAKRAELEAKRAEYADVFPPEELSHDEKVNRILKVLNKRKAELEAKLEALQNAKTPEERAKIIDGEKKEKVKDAAIDTLREEIEEIKSDIADLETTYFPAGTPEQIVAAIRNRISALEKNIEKNENKLLLSDLGLAKKEPSALKKLVESDREVIELTKKRNAVTKRLAEERKRYQRSLTPFSMGGKVLDWWEALTSAPRVFRTMLDLSATFTQAAALTASHSVLGARALVNSIKAFQSEMNTDEMQVALNNDPDWQEFQEMGGHAYVVSDIDERDIPEEFRGMDRKLLTVNGKEYGLTDIPYVGAAAKASERSFGMFLNTINLSLYKALKNASGWGPTGPSEWQKRDLAASINAASGYGYESKGGQGLGDKIFSFAMWAPRFAVSGLKMATAYNVWSPLLRGKTNERSYADRLTSSKMMAKEYVRNLVGMAAWTLLATLLFGRKDPEYLEEVLDPRSSEFLNVLIGNTRINFFGPIKQWWQFMARILTQKTRKDGKISKTTVGSTLMRFGRSKASPIVGTIWNVLDGKDFQGEEYTAGKFIGDLTFPLSAADLIEAFKENDVANALFLTPFIIAGAAKSTYQLNDYDMQVNPYRYLVRQINDLRKQKDFEGIKTLKKENPILMYTAGVDAKINRAHALDKQIKALEKDEKPVPDALQERFKAAQQEVIDFIKKHK